MNFSIKKLYDRFIRQIKPPPPAPLHSAHSTNAPSTTSLPLSMRDTLFGDAPPEQWPPPNTASSELSPWNIFVKAREHLGANRPADAIALWQHVLTLPNLESRHCLQAWHFLRQHGQSPAPENAKTLLGVVMEVPMPNGLDLLAAYADHTARYYNFSSAAVIWEHPDDSIDSQMDALFARSREVVTRIGPWDKPRLGPPAGDMIRLNFLTPTGLHFGQGSLQAIAQDPMSGPVFLAGAHLMQALIAKTKK